MNVFNRVLVSLFAIAAVVSAGAVLLVAVDAFQPAQLAPTAWLTERLTPFEGLSTGDYRWTIGATLALIIVGLALLILELLPSRSHERRVTPSTSHAHTHLDQSEIEALVNQEAVQVDGVRQSQATVEERDGEIRIHERIAAAPDANLPAVTRELQRRLRGSVERHVGRPVTEVNVETWADTAEPAPSRHS